MINACAYFNSTFKCFLIELTACPIHVFGWTALFCTNVNRAILFLNFNMASIKIKWSKDCRGSKNVIDFTTCTMHIHVCDITQSSL